MAIKMLAVFLVGTVLFFDATNALSCINCMYDSAGGSGSDSNCGETTSVAATDCGSAYTYDSCAKAYTKHILTGIFGLFIHFFVGEHIQKQPKISF